MRAADTLDHLVVRIDRLAGVAPVALEDVVLEHPGPHVMVVDVRDLQLAAIRRLERADHLEDVGPVAVEPGDREPPRWIRGLLDDLDDPSVLDPWNAQMPQVLRLLHVGEEDPSATLLPAEVFDRRCDRAAEDVVGQHDDDAFVSGEVVRKTECLGDPAGALLPAVDEIVTE